MSYQVLARKWRPYQFTDVVGQSHVLTALANALDQNRLHHAYLFSGTRGVGKTTIARIFAKGLNCEQGITATPCGQCVSCIEIEQGRSVDLLEIDAASRTKVEDTRELLDNVQYKPARSRYKIYLIDEVHMLSRHSFNALLKTLEEPPEYVKFILATTDPQKLPITILSRCLQFHLKHLQPEQIQNQLAHILAQEQISSDATALALLAHAADGSMRDALSLADQAIAMGGGEINYSQVSDMLGTISTDQALTLIESLIQASARTLFDLVAQFANLGMEWDALLKEVSEQFHRIALAQMLADSVNSHAPDAERLLKLAQQLTPQDVQLYYQIALQGRQDLPFAANAKSGFEMTLMRMLAFKPADIVPAPIVAPTPALTPATESNQQLPASNSTKPSAQLATAPRPAMPAIEQQATTPVAASVATTGTPPEAAPEEAPIVTEPETPMSSLLAARNKLRSQKLARQQQSPKAPIVAKPAPTSLQPSSRLQIATMQTAAPSTVMVAPTRELAKSEAEYRWQPTHAQGATPEVSITPNKIKTVLTHARTPEMKKKLALEAEQKDAWSLLASSLTISKICKQLALNAAMLQQGTAITLYLRSAQSHLCSNKNNAELAKALSEKLNTNIQLTVLLNDEQGVTPLEWRDRLYADKLQQAVKNVQQDSNISFIRERFTAVLDEESIRPI